MKHQRLVTLGIHGLALGRWPLWPWRVASGIRSAANTCCVYIIQVNQVGSPTKAGFQPCSCLEPTTRREWACTMKLLVRATLGAIQFGAC